jgi:hypothetical protein
VTVRPCGTDDDIAIFKNNTWSGGGTLELSSERTFRATTNCWQSKFAFETEAGEKLIEFETGGLLHLSATVGIQPSIITMTELPLMVTLALYHYCNDAYRYYHRCCSRRGCGLNPGGKVSIENAAHEASPVSYLQDTLVDFLRVAIQRAAALPGQDRDSDQP